MLAVFDKTVAKCPDALQSPHSAPAASVLKDGFLANHLASLHPGSVTVNLGTSGLIAYSLDKQNPLLPRYFFLFCLKKCDFFFLVLGTDLILIDRLRIVLVSVLACGIFA
jgi:hypothetical protein